VSNSIDLQGSTLRHPLNAGSAPHPARAWHTPFTQRPDVAPTPPSQGPAVVYVVDDDISVRESLEALIRFAGWETETFDSAQAFLDRPGISGPSCLVLDVHLPIVSGLDLQRRIASGRMEMPIIFITGGLDVPIAVQAMKEGAADFLTKPVREDVLLQAIEASLARSRAALDDTVERRAIQARHATLSPRERQVMALVVSGLLNKQIGGKLDISEITVKAHRGSAMRKMKARSLANLVEMAIKLRGSENRAVPGSLPGSTTPAAARHF
jgi:FixJ family two-component response regulator